MASLLNSQRPPLFCPGCSHEESLRALDLALEKLGLSAEQVAIVSDIGCSGLFDTYFSTHALHGLHGRALTYASGLKLARPDLKVIATMGDGGLGIGGAHLLAACRRNLDLTLLVLNNFSFAMTGGQFSCTTPLTASVASGFLNTLELPMDVCSVAASAGAPFVARSSVYSKDLAALLADALSFRGFSLVDIWGICPGRYTKKNKLTRSDIDSALGALPPFKGEVKSNLRKEYGESYREKSLECAGKPLARSIEKVFSPSFKGRREVAILGSAGERIISAGSILARAAISAGLHVTQKNDYNITVMRGPSITELVLSPEPILYTGVEEPDLIIALSREGVARRADLFNRMKPGGRVLLASGVEIPKTGAKITPVDFKALGIKKVERALASLFIISASGDPVGREMLDHALKATLKGASLDASLKLKERIQSV